MSRLRQQKQIQRHHSDGEQSQYLKSEGGSLNIRKCGDEKDWRWCVQIDPTVEKLYNNKFAVVQETN